jgi:hypothetical protein
MRPTERDLRGKRVEVVIVLIVGYAMLDDELPRDKENSKYVLQGVKRHAPDLIQVQQSGDRLMQ